MTATITLPASKYLPAARIAAAAVRTVFGQRDLELAAIRQYILTENGARAWLIVALDPHHIGRIERYTDGEVLHHISTTLRGKPVLLSNSTGLRYVVLLSDAPTLPSEVEYPGHDCSSSQSRGLLQLGVNIAGPVTMSWKELGHVLVAGMTGFGKSNFLRLLVEQGAAEGFKLALADPDGRTFPYFAGHPTLLAPLGATLDGCVTVLKKAEEEITRRAALFRNSSHNPDDINAYNATMPESERLVRLLVVVDEFNGLVQATGGLKGSVAQAATQIAWRGRKFGVTLVLAGQTFEKDIVGPVRDQLATRICFRVATPSVSRIVIGQHGAERLSLSGRALSTFGAMQVYRASKPQAAPPNDGLTVQERRLAAQLIAEHKGRVTFEALSKLGIPRRPAERLRADWESRGLAVRRAEQDNALCVAPSVVRAVQAGQTGQAAQTAE
ncbi:MAG: hypothetical protein HYZ49_19060 [Chloroflexi bacterium]|nr:hypothetical protein [Chloroflexota bacterium]